jgi:CBS domain-containing protein
MTEILERLKTLTVQDAMSSEAIEVCQDESLERSATIMMKHHVSGLPVVDGEGRCVGMLTAYDFVNAFASEQSSEHSPSVQTSVGSQMTAMVQSASKNTSLLDAARKMCDEHIHRLPVLDGSGRVTGVITSLDIVAAVANAADEQRVSPNHSQARRDKR